MLGDACNGKQWQTHQSKRTSQACRPGVAWVSEEWPGSLLPLGQLFKSGQANKSWCLAYTALHAGHIHTGEGAIAWVTVTWHENHDDSRPSNTWFPKDELAEAHQPGCQSSISSLWKAAAACHGADAMLCQLADSGPQCMHACMHAWQELVRGILLWRIPRIATVHFIWNYTLEPDCGPGVFTNLRVHQPGLMCVHACAVMSSIQPVLQCKLGWVCTACQPYTELYAGIKQGL